MEFRVRGVKVYWSSGKRYAYHRATGKRVRAPFGTAAFLAEIERLNAGVEPLEPKPGTLGALIAAYRASPEFSELAPRTRKDYQKVFNYLKPAEDDLISSIDAPYVLEARDAAFAKHKRRFANYVVAVLSLLLKWAVERKLLETNAAAGVRKLRRPRHTPKANPAWHESECLTTLMEATGGIRVAIALGWLAGMREGDALTLMPAAYNSEWLSWVQHKTGHPVDCPVDPLLKTILDEVLSARDAANVVPLAPQPFVLGERGKPYTGNGFRALFFRLMRRLAAEGKVRPGLTFHGLRHTAGKEVIEGGGSARAAGALLGHKTAAMTTLYTEEADRRQLAKDAVGRRSRNRMNETRTNLSRNPAGDV